MGTNLWLRAITEANLHSDIKMKVAWNTCDKELGGEMKSVDETTSKLYLKPSKSHSLLNKFMWEKQYTGIVYSYIT